MHSPEDPYEVLGVPPDADADQIKKAFRGIARSCHPDIAGDNPVKKARFMEARRAYEFLTNEEAKAAYDEARERAAAFVRRRNQRRSRPDGAAQRNFERHMRRGAAPSGRARPSRPGGSPFEGFDGMDQAVPGSGPSHRSTVNARSGGGGRFNVRGGGRDDMDLNDIFGGVGDFNIPSGAPAGGSRGRSGPRSTRRGGDDPSRAPRRGDDVAVEIGVPFRVARDGGTVPVAYDRLRRVPRWVPGDAWPGVEPGRSQTDVHIPMGTRHGGVLRVRGLGDAGAYGGPEGDLVVRINVVGNSADPATPGGTDSSPAEALELTVPIGMGTALLGGVIDVVTPMGAVKARVRPGTSGGTRITLRGKGSLKEDGTRGDVVVVVRVQVPDDLPPHVLERLEALVNDHPELL